jgi:hypothetical protein
MRPPAAERPPSPTGAPQTYAKSETLWANDMFESIPNQSETEELECDVSSADLDSQVRVERERPVPFPWCRELLLKGCDLLIAMGQQRGGGSVAQGQAGLAEPTYIRRHFLWLQSNKLRHVFATL